MNIFNYKQTKKAINLSLACTVLLAVLLLLSSMLSACDTAPNNNEDADLKIVTTLFVSFDLARSIAGEQADVSMLLPPGVDVHSYELTPHDIIKLNEADLFIYNGGHSESWVNRLLESEEINPGNTLKMMDFVELREEATSGILEADDHGHEDDDHDAPHGPVDEHIWTSPLNAIAMATAIKDKLIEIDGAQRDIYESNFSDLEADLNDLHDRFLSVVENGARDYIVVADRFPLIYFTSEYGLDYYAAYEACAAEAEPTPQTVTALIELVRAKEVPYIFTIEFSNERLADQIIEESGAGKLLFHTVHNLSQTEIEQGASYIGLMRQNVANLEQALADDR
ncbi:MAG: metal ABC transporter substrate-binding protein [Eubacteriales bacterium]|nr:metal ABC transporter substrate-binding protein [Eubacteriales bacterium]